MFHLPWQAYANWLIGTEGLDLLDALGRVSLAYRRQTGKAFETEKSNEIKDFIDHYYEGSFKDAPDKAFERKSFQAQRQSRNARR